MTNPNTDTVEAVARAICEACSGPFHLLSPEGQEACRVEARAAIAAMPGSAEAMREAAAKVAQDRHKFWNEYPQSHDVCDDLSACKEIATAIRALPLLGGGSAEAERDAAWAEVGRLSEVLRQIGRKDTKPYVQIGADPNFPGETLYVPGEYAEIAYAALEKSAAMLAAAPLPPAAEPYAWLCTSPELDPVIVYGRENAESYAAQPERWTVEGLYRGARPVAPRPPASAWQTMESAPKEFDVGYLYEPTLIGFVEWGNGKHRHVGPIAYHEGSGWEFQNLNVDVFKRPSQWCDYPAPPPSVNQPLPLPPAQEG